MHILKKIMSLNIKFRLIIIIIMFISLNCYAININNDLIILKNSQKYNKTINEKIIELEDKKYNKIIKSYIFYTNDITNILAYSGKPIELLIQLEENGIIRNLKIIKHSEPILLTGIPIEKLLEAIAFYKNKNINKQINIGENTTGELSIPIIAGATVTSLILHETIIESCNKITDILNLDIQKITYKNRLNNILKNYDWQQLIKIKAIKHFLLKEENSPNNFVDLYFADLKHPSIGKNILGDYYDDILEKSLDKSIILILNNGLWSFKGTAFVRGGIYDRFRIEQNKNIFMFRDSDFLNIYEFNLNEVDEFKEKGIFIVNNNNFKNTEKWNLILTINYKTYNISYKIPDIFIIKEQPVWIKTWSKKIFYLFIFNIIWLSIIIVFILRNYLIKNNFYLSSIYNTILILDIYLLGYKFEAQPSIVNIFTLIDDIQNLETFILDPFIFLSWIMIISTIFIWGKALFCGWVCPFGALQEILFKVKLLIFKNTKDIHLNLFNYLKYLKYIIFIILILLSFKNINLAQKLAEIEPFKTTWIIGLINRPIYIASYTILILSISVFIYRFFCRYICPLGAFFALLSTNVIIKLKRRETCKVCKICTVDCNSHAINEYGAIDTKECFGCFSCINKMKKINICPPITNQKIRAKYEKNIWW